VGKKAKQGKLSHYHNRANLQLHDFVGQDFDGPVIEVSSTEIMSDNDSFRASSLSGIHKEVNNVASDENNSEDEAFPPTVHEGARLSSPDLFVPSSSAYGDDKASMADCGSDNDNFNNDACVVDDTDLESEAGYGQKLIGRLLSKRSGGFDSESDNDDHPVVIKKPRLVSLLCNFFVRNAKSINVTNSWWSLHPSHQYLRTRLPHWIHRELICRVCLLLRLSFR
jgi:hypothetical protein